MGEVWRARDTRLGREVAIKVLPADVSSDADRLKRFEKEARAASSLNHPAIVTIYEVGREGGIAWMAMELVDGSTLRQLIAAGPIAVRRLLAIAAQVADGLAKAHASGIVHRDLKPENVMVSKDGFAKILDFGLAKLVDPESGGGRESFIPTRSAGTEPGLVMGTVGYMSPEQARGEALDFRSDQFAFGALLYEMATGRRAFRGETKPEVLAAILRDDPEPLALASPKLPAPLRWLIERCLSKSPGERYAATDDLARDLRDAESHLAEFTTASAPAGGMDRVPSGRARAIAIASAAVAGLVLGAAGWALVAGRSRQPADVPLFHRVTFQRGNVLHARFAPDGQTILYAASWEGRPMEVFSTRVDGTESRPLGLGNADIAAVSESGELLVLLRGDQLRHPIGISRLARVPLSGGAPRAIAESVHAAGWLRGGGVVVQRHIAYDHDVLELPLGTGRFDYTGSAPAVSRDGRFVAVARVRGGRGEVVVLDEKGTVLRTVGADADQLAWHPGGELWFSRVSGEESGLFAIARSGSVRPVLKANGWVLHDIAPDGRLLLERGISRTSLRARRPKEAKERELSWLDGSKLAGASGDFDALLFSETNEAGSRAGGVYLRPTDGGAAVRLSDGSALAFSEDGRWAFVRGSGTAPKIAFVPTGAGEPVFLDFGADGVVSAVFLPGPEPRVVATVGDSPDKGHLEIVTPTGRRPIGISPGFTPGDAVVSPDGGSIAYGTSWDKDAREIRLCRLGDAACRPLPLESAGTPCQWSADGRSLFLRERGGIPVRVTRYEIATGARTDWLRLGPEDATDVIGIDDVALSRDGRAYAYDAGEIRDSSLFVVSGLR
ncbi:MAG: serine/threonine protein kinase [Holophagales bacterium]|nr:serine/threonine protein kinase [Holophagales bacterium]